MVKNPPAKQETQVRSLGWEDPLEKGMAAHSSILAWEIPWTEEPGGLQSMASQSVYKTYQLNNSNMFDEMVHIYFNVWFVSFKKQHFLSRSFPYQQWIIRKIFWVRKLASVSATKDEKVHLKVFFFFFFKWTAVKHPQRKLHLPAGSVKFSCPIKLAFWAVFPTWPCNGEKR